MVRLYFCFLHDFQSPLHAAALDNKDQFVRLLLAHRADVNMMDASGERPLALALKNRSTECILIIREQLGEFIKRITMIMCYFNISVNNYCCDH